MKNKSVVMLLIIIIFLSFAYELQAYNVKVTQNNLESALKTYDEQEILISSIQVTENQLICTKSDEIYYIDYSLSANPIFSVRTEINKETDLKTLTNLRELLKKPVIGFIGVAIVQGKSVDMAEKYVNDVKPFRKENYIMMRTEEGISISLDDETKTFKQEDFNVSELVTFLFEEKKVVNDEKNGRYTYTVTTTQTESDNYVVEAVMEINEEADFGMDTNNNSSNSVENTNSNVSNYVENINNNASKNEENSNNNNFNNININNNTNIQPSLPRTGKNINVFVIIIFAIILIIFSIINFKRYKE